MDFVTRFNAGNGYVNDPDSPINGQVISVWDVDVGYYFIDHSRNLDGLVRYDGANDFQEGFPRWFNAVKVEGLVYKMYMQVAWNPDAPEPNPRPYEDFQFLNSEKYDEWLEKFTADGHAFPVSNLDNFLTERTR